MHDQETNTRLRLTKSHVTIASMITLYKRAARVYMSTEVMIFSFPRVRLFK